VIKQFIYHDPATRAKALELFDEEAVRLDDLGQHPQIPTLLAHCQQDGRSYLVQEFVDGVNLQVELDQRGALSEAAVRDVLGQVLGVLDYIHRRQVIHRDIKPENIMRRSRDQQLVLVDFGAAKYASATALAKTGTTIGSASYAAPEQARGKATFASDLYSLGVTCLHLLTGVDPFTLFDDLNLSFAWRDFLNGKQVSGEFGKVLDKLTQYRPVDRYGSVDEVLAALGQSAAKSVSPAPSPAPQPKPTVTVQPTANKTAFQPATPQGNNNILLDCGNGIKLELVRIPAGSFMMGSNEYNDEKPIHRVNVPEFLMAKYQVTQAQYEAVMGKNPSLFKGKQNPVEQVSWHEAQEFCKKLAQKTGRKVKLPSEAQWEYACRAGSTGKYCFGDNVDQLEKYAWCNENSNYTTHPVGEKLANAWGLYDMHGNVWEWCEDVWHDSYNGAPSDGSAWLSRSGEFDRMLRGGSWFNDANRCRIYPLHFCSLSLYPSVS
jgi:formylglycine-generating enzyme required for sulfatase activity